MPHEILISPQLDVTQLKALARQAEQLDRLLENNQPIAQTGVLEQLGARLWEASGLQPDALLTAIDRALDDKTSVRLTITDATLHQLPWELLYHQHPQLGFVGRHQSCVIVRRFKGSGQHAPTLLPRPFRLLLFISSPEDLPPERGRLDFEKEEELLFTALDRPWSKGDLIIDVAEDGCVQTLMNRLEEQQYHAVIMSMHGAPARDEHGKSEWGLLFEDQQTGRSAAIAGSMLAQELSKVPQQQYPGLVLLSACRSAKAEESAESITTVAKQLHDQGFERVLGMRLSVIDGAASAFSAELFRRLAQGESVGRAVTLARDKVAEGVWLSDNGTLGKGEVSGDVYAQWTLPVLLDRTADGPLVAVRTSVIPQPHPPLPLTLAGDGTIALPTRSAFVGRRSLLRQHLRPFLDGDTRGLMLTGPGGMGKTTLAALFVRLLQERQPNARAFGFQAPFHLDTLYEPLREAAFADADDPILSERLGKELDRREQIRLLLTSLASRPRPCAFVLDNLESLQELATLEIAPGHEDSQWFVRTVCGLPAPTRVLLTGRYRFPALPRHVHYCAIPDAPYGDILLRMNRLQWPHDMGADKKRWVYNTLGGNHRAIEWTAHLFTHQQPTGEAVVAELAKLQAPPDTPEAMVEVVREAMRQNLLFAELRRQLTPAQDHLLRAACLPRVPVNTDGLLALESQPEQAEANRERLVAYALLEPVQDREVELDYFLVPPIVKDLLGDGEFSPTERQSLHRAIGHYHRFQGQYLSKRWGDDIEAIYHLRQAGDHEEADALAEDVCNFYYRISNYAAASALAAEIVQRETPPPPWWALNRYGMCQLTLGFPATALTAFEHALPLAPSKEDEGTTLNNLSQIYKARGDYDTALRYLEESLQIRRAIGDKAGMIATLHNMASIALQAQDGERAFTLWSEALSLALDTRNAQGIFHVAGTLGTLLAQAGDKAQAAQLLTLAIDAGKQAGFPGVEELEEELRRVQG